MSELRSDGFGTTESGQRAELYTFSNVNGLEISITNFGGRIVSIKAPDRKGQLADIVLGFDELAGYLRKNPYLGAIV
ncbi:MAG: galactose-1-epimerase, partial [Acidobacteriaceae bacterium]|nr:galactose-1-epimerase [Acidobacteriaceae bacterium]